MKNISVRSNANGTSSVQYRRQFKGHVHKLPFNQISGATLEEKFAQIKAINNYLERMYEMTKSRISMMDIINSKKHISITGTPNKNARVVIYRGTFSTGWSVNKYGLDRALNIAIASLLTLIGVHDKGNRVILGAVLKRRALDEFNILVYNQKKFGGIAAPAVRKELNALNKKFKACKYGLSKSSHIVCDKTKVQAYVYLQYAICKHKVWSVEKNKMVWDSKVMKCVVLDSIDSEVQGQGNFKAYMNEVLKFATRSKFDAVRIVNVVNDDFAQSLARSNVFVEEPTSLNGDTPVFDSWFRAFSRILVDFFEAPNSKRDALIQDNKLKGA